MYFSSDSNYCHNGCRACCGDGFSVFSSDNGIVLTCGDGSVGCLGHGDWLSISRPRLIEALLRFDHVVLSTNATRSLTHSAQRNHCLLSLFAFQANEERKRKKERLGAWQKYTTLFSIQDEEMSGVMCWLVLTGISSS